MGAACHFGSSGGDWTNKEVIIISWQSSVQLNFKDSKSLHYFFALLDSFKEELNKWYHNEEQLSLFFQGGTITVEEVKELAVFIRKYGFDPAIKKAQDVSVGGFEI